MSGIGAAPGEVAGGNIPEIGVGMLGYAFMGKAHSNAFRKIAVHDLAAAARPAARLHRRTQRGGGRATPPSGTGTSAGRPTGTTSSPIRP